MKQNTSFGQALLYGMPAGPLAMLGIPLYIYLPTYYYQLGVELGVVGAMLLLARISDVFSDPLIGWLRDYSGPRGRYGLMIVGWFLLLIGLWQLLLPNGDVGALHLLLWAMWVYLAWTLIMIPYQALSAEVSQQHHLKTYYTAAREAFSMIGVVAVLVLPFLLPDPQDYRAVFALLYPLLAVSLSLSLLLMIWHLRLVDTSSVANAKAKLRSKFSVKIIRVIWRDAASRRLLPAYFLNSLANGLSAPLFLLFVNIYLQLTDYTGLLLLVFFFTGVVALPFWVLLSKKVGKYTAWRMSMMSACLSFIWVFFIEPGSLWVFAFISGFAGLSVGADVALPSSIQADIAQDLSIKNGALSGLMFGIWGMLTKLALALAVGLSFPVLDWFGLEQQTIQSQYALVWLYAGVPIVIKLYVFYSLRESVT